MMEEALEIETRTEKCEYEFRGDYPITSSAKKALDDSDIIRAIIAYRFFYPTVSFEASAQGQRDAGVQDNKQAMIFATGPRHILFTGNSDTPYMGLVFNLADTGPMVIELPPGPYIGVVNDHNFRWVHDLGLAGDDHGKGGKHLIFPPGHDVQVRGDYYVAQSKTFLNFFGARALPSNGDINTALDAQRNIKVYPLSQPGAKVDFLDKTSEKINVTPLEWEDNLHFWIKLYKVIQEEPPQHDFNGMYGILAALGIEKGKPFSPSARMVAILERAAKIGRDQLLVSAFASNRADRFVWPDRKWEWATLRWENGDFETPAGTDMEARERWFAQAVAMSPKMVLRSEGAGSLYWLGIRDNNGEYLNGAKTYKLAIPQPVPQNLFWSVTVYDSKTRSQIQTDQDKAALRSLVELKDIPKTGTVNLYFGPTPPPGKQSQWIKTNPGHGWFVYLRLYGPQQAAFDGTWKPGDFESL